MQDKKDPNEILNYLIYEFSKETRLVSRDIFHLMEKFGIKKSEIKIKNNTEDFHAIFESLLHHEKEVRSIEFGSTGKNFLYHRDRWIQFSIDAIVISEYFFNKNIHNKAWLSLNLATRYIAKAEVISRIHMCTIVEIEEKQKKSASRKMGAITKKSKDLLAEIFKIHAPIQGWPTMKLAIHQITPHLLDEIKSRNPNATQEKIEAICDNNIKNITKWMRTDLAFKMKIERHLQDKAVPDLSDIDFFKLASKGVKETNSSR